jgi:micrococcal nuclease
MTLRIRTPLLVSAAVIALAACAPVPGAAGLGSLNKTGGTVTVKRVVDGDTFVLADGRRVRLAGINAPEVDACFGSQATNALRAAVEGKAVRLELGEKATIDKYGRTLAYVWRGPVLENEALVRAGDAREQYYGDNAKYRGRYLAAQAQAKTAHLGLWGACPTSGGSSTAPATGSGSVYYANCTAVRAAGKAPLLRGQPGYRDALDGDHDGIACE